MFFSKEEKVPLGKGKRRIIIRTGDKKIYGYIPDNYTPVKGEYVNNCHNGVEMRIRWGGDLDTKLGLYIFEMICVNL